MSFLPRYITLKPGDIVTSGTGPGCAIENGADSNRWLKSGDQVEVEIEGAGILRKGWAATI